MESAAPADTGKRLCDLFGKILQSNITSLDQEIDTFLSYILRQDVPIDPKEKVQKVWNILHDSGEEACQWIMENLRKNGHVFPRILRILNKSGTYNMMFMLLIEDLGLGGFLQRKLTLSEVQSLCCNASCRSMKVVPIHFLRNLMALNIQEAFRSFDVDREADQSNPEPDSSNIISGSVHPLDVLCGLLHCSDNFLQQEIIRRMSQCRVPIPLLLPAGRHGHGTFLLWAMRGITKNHSPSLSGDGAFIEDSVVNISLPVFSFVSLGKCRSISITKIIDQIVTAPQQNNEDNLVHRVMGWGNIPRYISNGLVEISWYFPLDQMDLKELKKPFAVTHLHGDLQSNMRQLQFLTQVSSAVFIFMENMTEEQRDLLLHNRGNSMNYYYIVQDQINQESSKKLGLKEENVLLESEENFMEKLQLILINTIQEAPKNMTLSEMSVVASNLNFCSDESQLACEYGRLHSLEVIDDIENAKKCNKEDLNQQQLSKIRIAEIEKELCRLMEHREGHTSDYKLMLKREKCNLLGVLWDSHRYSDIGINLQYSFTHLSSIEQQYFLKWAQFQKFSTNAKNNKKIEDDVLRKVGELYETEVLTGEIGVEIPKLCGNFPTAAADLLLQGIPLELIDGDTKNIHLSWIMHVLTSLCTKTNGRCRVQVISVLGIQGTGKSTLLNTMFGLQLPVSRCTRGALMSLIKVEERDLGCDFLVVIDCEGLRALDMASVEEIYHPDNEFATLVVGLSDIAIINTALGSTSDMQDILQIVSHALLRMKGNRTMPKCLSIYQMIEGSSEEEMVEDQERLCLGAHTDEQSSPLQYDEPKECKSMGHYWIIPPFQPEASGYSKKVIELKQHLLQMVKHQSSLGEFRNLQNFADDICALWNSVKHENYIFKFKNILEEKVYTELYERFLKLEWNLCRKMYRRWEDFEGRISTQHPSKLHVYDLDQDISRMLDEEVKTMEGSFKDYFLEDSKNTNSHVAKKFETEFMEKVQSLKCRLKTQYLHKCVQIVVSRGGLANTIVKDFTQEELDPHETNLDVEGYYDRAVTYCQSIILKRHDVFDDFLQLLRWDMRTKGSLVNELIHSITSLSAPTSFTNEAEHINELCFLEKCDHTEICETCRKKRDGVTKFLFEKTSNYVEKMIGLKTAYDPVYGMEMLNMVNGVIREDTVSYTLLFELDLKYQILAKSAPYFQKAHDEFVQKCKVQFDRNLQDRTGVINYLRSLLQDKEIIKNYCQVCLKPAVELKVKEIFQQNLVSDFTNHLYDVMKSRQRFSEGSHELRGSEDSHELRGSRGSHGMRGFEDSHELRGSEDSHEFRGSRGSDGMRGFEDSNEIRGFGGSHRMRGSEALHELRGSRGSNGMMGSEDSHEIRGFGGSHELRGSEDLHELRGSRGSHGMRGCEDSHEIRGFGDSHEIRGSGGSHGMRGSEDLHELRSSRGSHGMRGSEDLHEMGGSGGSHELGGSEDLHTLRGSRGSHEMRRSGGSHEIRSFGGSHELRGSEDLHELRGSRGSHGMRGCEDSYEIRGFGASHEIRGSGGSHGMRGSEDLHELRNSRGSHGMRGSEDSHEMKGSGGSHWMRGCEDSHEIRGSGGSHELRGSEDLHELRGSSGSHWMRGSKDSHEMRGSEGSHWMTGSEDSHWMRGSENSHEMRASESSHWMTGSEDSHGIRGSEDSHGMRGFEGSHGMRGFGGSQGMRGCEDLHGIRGSENSYGMRGSEGSHGERGFEDSHEMRGSGGSQGMRGCENSYGMRDSGGSYGTSGSEDSNGMRCSKNSYGTRGTGGSHGMRGSGDSQGMRGSVDSQGMRGSVDSQGMRGSEDSHGMRGPESSHSQRGSNVCTNHASVEDTLKTIRHRYTDHREIKNLLTNILSSVIGNIRIVLKDSHALKTGNIRNLMATVWSVVNWGTSGVEGEFSNVPLNVTSSNIYQFASYLDFFVQKLEAQIQEEFSPVGFEEICIECLNLINRKVLVNGSKIQKQILSPRDPRVDRVNIS